VKTADLILPPLLA